MNKAQFGCEGDKMKDKIAISKDKGIVNITATTEKVDVKMSEKKENKDLLLEEWKESRNSIARFDQIIIDIRKYGFTFITGLLSAEAYLFITISGLTPLEKIGITVVNLALIYALFRIDRYHEIFLMGAVQNSINLEADLDFKLSIMIHKYINDAHTDEWGSRLYRVFGGAAILPALTSVVSFDREGVIFILIMILIGFVFYYMLFKYDMDSRYQIEIPPKFEDFIEIKS